jgi:DNA-binding NarL/FixJ family response regulator
MTPLISIGLFDDHPIVLQGLVNNIDANQFKIVFATSSKDDFFDQLQVSQPDVLIIDIVSDEVFGLEVFERILILYPYQKIIAFSSLDSIVLVDNLLSIGVKGFTSKKNHFSKLEQAILSVMQDKIALPEDYKHLTKGYVHQTAILTAREIEIINMIGKEYTSQQIGDELILSIHTIESHRRRIFQKLDVKNVAGMIMEASRLGYLKH